MPSRDQAVADWSPIWVTWLVASAAGVAAATSFFYMTFETKKEADQVRTDQVRFEDELLKRIDRIESKVDQLKK